MVEGQPTIALLDTGSQVSCLSESFYDQYLSHIELQELSTLLEIEGVGGTLLPYKGFVEVNLVVPGQVLGHHKSMLALFLVTKDTRYNRHCPVLIGTNIISYCWKLHDSVRGTPLPDAWKVAFRCVAGRTRGDESVAQVTVTSSCQVAPMSSVVVNGHCGLQCDSAAAVLVESSSESTLPAGLLVTPALYQKTDISDVIPIHVVNLSRKTVTIPENCIVCAISPARVVTSSVASTSTSSQIQEAFPLQHLSEEQRKQVYDILELHRNAFSWNNWDLGHCDKYVHHIKLTDETPFRDRYRRIPPALVDEVREHIQQMLDTGIIRESSSPYSSASVFVRKPDGSLRVCVDFRRLNSRTIRDSHYLPRIDDTFDRMAGSSWYSNLDLKSGYYQCGMHEDDIKYTGFSCGNLGFFEYCKMPMGLVNAAATFQRLMESVMGSLNLQVCLLYLDDIIVFSDSFESQLYRLELVLSKLEEAGLKLKPSKCNLFQRQVKYLGHVLSERGIETDPAKIEKVRSWPIPTDHKQLHRFLAFCGYYRRFIRNFSALALPLQKLLRGVSDKSKTGRSKPKKKGKSRLIYPPFTWGPDQQNAFDKLVQAVTDTPVLAYADFSRPFLLQTDASTSGLGAILSQEVEGTWHPIAFASRGLTPSEANYPAHKLEFLALKWAVCQKFYDYLYGAKFEVITDNNPLTYVMTTAKLDATGLRWVAALSSFDFSIRYKPGKQNCAADALSRLNDEYLHWSEDTVKAVCNGVEREDLITSMSLSVGTMLDESVSTTSMSRNEWAKLQADDRSIDPIIRALQGREKFTSEDPDARKLWTHRKRLIFEEDVLYRTCTVSGKTLKQLVLPKASRTEAMKMLHDDMGHFGRNRMLDLLRTRFFWPGMIDEVKAYVENCMSCIKRKRWEPRAELVNIKTSYPMEMVSMDYLSLETSIGGHSNILVLTDHFTRFAMAIPTKNQTAKTTAIALVDLFVNHYGLPHRLHSDNGANFTSNVIKEMCKMLGIERSTTTVYHPSGNGQTEKFNKTLLDMLATLSDTKKSHWKDYVKPLVHAYNCTKCSVTGYSPFFLMFGREPRLPIDFKFGLVGKSEEISYKEYVEDLRRRLEEAYELAKKNITSAQTAGKKQYDKRVRGNRLDVGDRVLLRKTRFEEGKHKLANHWEDEVYEVQNQLDDLPVYIVKPESGKGKLRRLHRNNLLPIGKGNEASSERSSSSSTSEEEYGLGKFPSERNAVSDMADKALERTTPIKEQPEPDSPDTSESEAGGQSPSIRPIPRRSGRIRKAPDRYQASGLNQVTAPDDKLQILSKILDFLNK